MKFSLLVADCPYKFGDSLTMSEVKRGAASHYVTMSTQELIDLDVKSILADQAILALWCPSSMLEDGFAIGRAWGFDKYVGTWTWVKRNKLSDKLAAIVQARLHDFPPDVLEALLGAGKFAFGMGHVFRGATEHALIFRRGKKIEVAQHRRNCYVGPSLPNHSEKPEALQNDLDAMYPEGERLELFARRQREGTPEWRCTGLECDGYDVREILAWVKEN